MSEVKTIPGVFASVSPSRKQVADMDAIRSQCDALLTTFRAIITEGSDYMAYSTDAEKAIGHLVEFSMWANRAICRPFH
jgi:hypothetical protein